MCYAAVSNFYNFYDFLYSSILKLVNSEDNEYLYVLVAHNEKILLIY